MFFYIYLVVYKKVGDYVFRWRMKIRWAWGVCVGGRGLRGIVVKGLGQQNSTFSPVLNKQCQLDSLSAIIFTLWSVNTPIIIKLTVLYFANRRLRNLTDFSSFLYCVQSYWDIYKYHSPAIWNLATPLIGPFRNCYPFPMLKHFFPQSLVSTKIWESILKI